MREGPSRPQCEEKCEADKHFARRATNIAVALESSWGLGDSHVARLWQPWSSAGPHETFTPVGTRTTNFQFSGQQIDGTGLAYLRARYYSGTFGRFLTRDVWEGDPNQPMSHNGWLYASANPANLTDSSGMYWTDPQCEAVLNLQAREICRADRVRDWQSRTQEPPYTNWSPAYLDISVAPGITTTGPGAQFHVPGYLVSEVPGITECDILETPDLELCQRNTQYCGQISIAAMLALNAQTVVSVWHKYAVRAALGWEEWEGATGHQLAGFVNESYGDRFRATSFTEYGSLSLRWVWDTLHRHTFIMPLVSIVSGNSDPVSGGRVGPGIVLHWVVITGVSSEARLNAEEHFTNWLRIYNPFTNMREYYRWSVFEDAWTRDPYGPDFVIFDPSKRPFPG